MRNWRIVIAVVALAVVLLVWAAPVLGRSVSAGPDGDRMPQRNADTPPPPESDLELARQYTPVLYFHPAEVFRPQPVDVIVERARLRQTRRLWFDVNVLHRLDVLDLFHLDTEESLFLDVWYGDDGSSAYTNYSAHRAYYEAVLSPEAGGPPIALYAHVVRDENPDHITVQYWALYFYNDWFNKHEGDWEMAQVILTVTGEPEWVVLSQHHGGTRRAWPSAPVEDGTHPVVYVALGSHANYFAGDEIYPNGKDVGNRRIEIMDRTGSFSRVTPEVILLPDRAGLSEDPGAWAGAEWLPFRGRWGEAAVQSDFGGPLGPADKGMKWEQPYTWGMAQPLDTDAWYANRLRVEVVGATADEAQVHLTDEQGETLSPAEMLGSLAILHADPPDDTRVMASISAPPNTRQDVVATWPDAAAGRVIRMRFANVPFAASGRATLTLEPGGRASLAVDGASEAGTDLVLGPSERATSEATWDAPDLVWIGGILPAQQVGTGLLLAMLASAMPALVYVGVLYWVDRYEKEPKRLLAAAFVWGAIPAVAMAVAAELFFRLPPDLIGTRALEAARLGIAAPVLQEALKGAVVVFIAWRYRREFDNVLDGIIYGATVGFGFAMTGNLLSHIGSFLLWGFDGLSVAVFAEGLIRGMNQAFYTAVFGAGLGFARLAQRRWHRWALPVGGYVLAVATHALHNLLARTLLGLNAWTVITTGAGLLLVGIVAGWSLARQRRCLQVELAGEVPETLYHTTVTPGARTRVQWQALRTNGLKGWRQARQLHQLCAELAFKKMQRQRRLDEPDAVQEIERLRREIRAVANLSGCPDETRAPAR
jgi:RsiW-degrading membrane proteinase PrsW (M82 family)